MQSHKGFIGYILYFSIEPFRVNPISFPAPPSTHLAAAFSIKTTSRTKLSLFSQHFTPSTTLIVIIVGQLKFHTRIDFWHHRHSRITTKTRLLMSQTAEKTFIITVYAQIGAKSSAWISKFKSDRRLHSDDVIAGKNHLNVELIITEFIGNFSTNDHPVTQQS